MNIADQHGMANRNFWHNGHLQLLGLCPLLAVSTTVVAALGLGVAMLVIMTCSNLAVSLLRHQLPAVIKLPVVVMLIAALTTVVGMLMQAYMFKLYQTLGIFVPLIVTNWMLLDCTGNFAGKHPPLPAMVDGIRVSVGFMLMLVALGAIRELLGTGALFANMEQLLPFAAGWKLQLFTAQSPFLLATSPPGAFLAPGFLIALRNVIDTRLKQTKPVAEVNAVAPGSKRARVTGHI